MKKMLVLTMLLAGCAAEVPGDTVVPARTEEAITHAYCAPTLITAAQNDYIAREVANGGNAASCVRYNGSNQDGHVDCRVFDSHGTWIRFDTMYLRQEVNFTQQYDVQVQDVRGSNGVGGWPVYGWYSAFCICEGGKSKCYSLWYAGPKGSNPNGNDLPEQVGISN